MKHTTSPTSRIRKSRNFALKALATISLLVSLSACASTPGTYQDRISAGQQTGDPLDRIRVGPGDWADTGTTAIGIWGGKFVEGNSILASTGNAAPLVMPPLKYAGKHGLVALGFTPREANKTMESVGMGAACWNVSLLAGATTGIGAGLALGCGYLYYQGIDK